MRRLLLAILLLGLSITVFACSNKVANKEIDKGQATEANEDDSVNESDDGVLAGILEEGQLNIGTEGTYPPFTFHDDSGKLTGYDVEVIEEIASRLDVDAKFHETQWDAMFAGLDAKRFDLIANQVGINDEREEKYDFSDAYTRSNAVLLISKDTEDIESFTDMDGKKSAQSLTSNYAEQAESYGAELVKVEGFNQAIELVISKRVDGTFNDKLSALDFLQEKPDAPIKLIDEAEDVSENAFMFRKGNEELIEEINKHLNDMREDGTLKKISEKWFGEDVS